jgi:HEAT repeat protein
MKTIIAAVKGSVATLAGLSLMFSLVVLASSVALRAQTPQEKAWKILEDGIHSDKTDQRSTAVRVLGLTRDDRKAETYARNALGDDKPEVRAAGATALGQMGARSAEKALEKAMSDKENQVVLAAAQSLLLLKDNGGYEAYYAILTGQRKAGQSLLGQQLDQFNSPKKIAQFGFEEGIGFVPFASIGWQAIKALTKDDVSPVRAAAAKVLANDPDPESGKALAAAVKDKSWIVRAAAIEAIAKRADPSLLESVEPAMSDEKEPVRYAAAATVLRLSEAAAAEKRRKETKKE